jgi:hypothetical protein
VACIAGILAAHSGRAQPGLPATATTPVLKVNARIVVLDVVVTDKDSHVVHGLARGDFTIYEDKALQTIRTFEAPDQHRLPAGVAIDSTADLAKAPNAAEQVPERSARNPYPTDSLDRRHEYEVSAAA